MAMPGALGAAAFTVLMGLEAGGAEGEVVEGARILMQEYFEKLSDEDCNVLCDILYARLKEDFENNETSKSWY